MHWISRICCARASQFNKRDSLYEELRQAGQLQLISQTPKMGREHNGDNGEQMGAEWWASHISGYLQAYLRNWGEWSFCWEYDTRKRIREWICWLTVHWVGLYLETPYRPCLAQGVWRVLWFDEQTKGVCLSWKDDGTGIGLVSRVKIAQH